jgi:hypothetical protein
VTTRDLDWSKSSFSANQGNCVEVARLADGMAVRDSKHPDAGMLTFTPAEWQAFVAGCRAGEFDIA